MSRLIQVISFLALTLLFSSCFKKDEMIPAHVRGNAVTDTIGMTDNYKYQVYYDLGDSLQVSRNAKTLFDLSFECSPDGWKILLNTADFMKCADLGAVPFGQPRDTTGLKWKFDKSDGNPDSLAFGKWFQVSNNDTLSLNHVYLIDRGSDENGITLGFRQFIVDSLRHGVYYFRYAGMNGSNAVSAVAAKDPSVNSVQFSFASGSVVKLEPPKGSYDLLFTQYTTLLYTDLGEAYPYLVTGVLINPNEVEVAKDTLNEFSAITFDIASSNTFSRSLDVIGYDWKYYSFSTGGYTVKQHLCFIIRDTQGFLYKLRFIGFYDAGGHKGYPVIEYQKL